MKLGYVAPGIVGAAMAVGDALVSGSEGAEAVTPAIVCGFKRKAPNGAQP